MTPSVDYTQPDHKKLPLVKTLHIVVGEQISRIANGSYFISHKLYFYKKSNYFYITKSVLLQCGQQGVWIRASLNLEHLISAQSDDLTQRLGGVGMSLLRPRWAV